MNYNTWDILSILYWVDYPNCTNAKGRTIVLPRNTSEYFDYTSGAIVRM